MGKAKKGSREAQHMAERQVVVAKLRRAGWTQRQIADHCGVSPATVNRDCQTNLLRLHDIARQDTDGWRSGKLEHYQTLRDALMDAMRNVRNPRDVAPLAMALMRIDERESKLLGLDAPEPVATAVVMSDEEAERILAKYGESPPM